MVGGSVVRRVDGYLVVIDVRADKNGKFAPHFWIYAKDTLAAQPIASVELPADCLDRETAAAIAEELARVEIAKLQRGKGARSSEP